MRELPYLRGAVSALALSLAMASGAHAQADDGWDVSGFVENATFLRNHVGLTKARNTAQLEFTREFGAKGLFSSFSISGVLRGTYDAVYDLNENDFGKKAGGPVSLTGIGVPAGSLGPGSPAIPPHFTPFGQSIVTAGTPGLPPGNAFGFDTNANPNQGLVILGSAFHPQGTGVVLAVPVRPCNIDPRGCISGYLDFSLDELRFPEFNKRADFLRELYMDATIPVGGDGQELGIRLGRQQVVWGRTDLFRVLDIINPVDFSRNNIYDELEDIRIPRWALNTELRLGAQGPFSDLNFAFVWNFDHFRPNNLGQGGTPNSILDAGSFFRAMKLCWDLGCSVGNFAGGGVTTDFGPHQIGIRRANVPKWALNKTDVHLKMEGVVHDIGFSLNYGSFISQLPSLRGGIPAQNSFTGGPEQVWPYLIAFDIDFPRIHLYGGSADLYIDPVKTAVRLEAAYTTGEEFANTLQPRLFSKSDVLRYVIGLDRPTFIPFLNRRQAFLFSAQLFGQHILDHQLADTPGSLAGIPGFGKAGIPDWKDNWIATLLVRGQYHNGQLNPQVITAYDFRAQAAAIAPSLEWLINDHWKLNVGANFKVGTGARTFDDCRSCNPFPPFTATPLHANPFQPGSVGLSGFEPLGRFRQGPIGTAIAEDEIQMTLRYRF